MQGATYRRAAMSGVMYLLVLLLVLCLADCAKEQRINRGNKPTNLGQKVNGYRSQRGGSCLSYGHSCWGGHGKRSVPENYKLIEMMKRMVERDEQEPLAGRVKSNDYSVFYDDAADDVPTNLRPFGIKPKFAERLPLDLSMYRIPEAKPMLDDRIVPNIQLLNVLRHYNLNEE